MIKKGKDRKVGIKIIWVMISYIGILCLTVGFVTYAKVYDRTGYGAFADIFSSSDQEYLDSDYFNSIYLDSINRLADYIEYKKLFETENVYDGEKLINIKSYVTEKKAQPDSDEAKNQSAEPNYYLKNLLEWAERGWEYSGEQMSEVIEEAQPQIAITDENVTYGLEESTEDYYIVEENLQRECIKEEFLPANGKSIEEFAQTPFEQEQLQSYLSAALEQISEDFIYYKELEQSFQNTNFLFYVYDEKEDTVYTNTKVTSADELRSYGKYVEANSEQKGYETNMKFGYRELYDNLCRYSTIFDGEYIIVTAVDTAFPEMDDFVQQGIPYENILPWLRLIFAIMVFGVLALMISLIMLTGKAGITSESEEIKLNRFDRIKTEIAALLIILLGLGTVICSTVFLDRKVDLTLIQTIIYSSIFASIFIGVEHTWFLIGYTSLVRRIKAGTLWKNSLCKWFADGVVAIMCNLKVTGRLMSFYTVFLLTNVILIRGSNRHSASGFICILLLLAIDILIGIKVLEEAVSRQKVKDGIHCISNGDLEYKISLESLNSDNRELAEAVNHVGEGLYNAVEESLKNERLKTDLITNVSHDIKTPLTSIINYVDLLRRENIDNEKVKGYIEVLENKSQRLKHLTEDLVEVSKVSSGNINLKMEKLNFVELIHQTIGEFNEKFQTKNLELITNLPRESVFIIADGRRLWRVIENLYNNIAKYAMENTRVYADLTVFEEKAQFSIKNISSQALNFSGDELTERFIRGDVSRSTEGSGLGLSIAKSLTQSQGGEFNIYLDGDLFKVTVRFDIVEESIDEQPIETQTENS